MSDKSPLELILAMEARERRLASRRKAFIEAAQRECPHPTADIREADHLKLSYLGSLPPFRVCTRCGYAEDGWHCGYWKLLGGGAPIPVLPRDHLQAAYVKRKYGQDELTGLRYGRAKQSAGA